MKFSAQLIEELKKAKGLERDIEIVEMIPGMDKGNLSKIKKGEVNRTLNEEQALFIARECGMNPDWVLVNLAAEKTKSEEAKAAWANIAKKLSRSAVAAVLAVVLVFCGVQSNNSGKAVFA